MRRLHILVDQWGWNAENHADALRLWSPPNWEITTSLWNGENHAWNDDHEPDVILNIGTQRQAALKEQVEEFNPILLSRFYCCYPRNKDKLENLLKYSDMVLVESRLCHERCSYLGAIRLTPTGVDCTAFRSYILPWKRAKKALWCAGIGGSNKGRASVKQPGLAEKVRKLLKPRGIELDIKIVDPHGERLNRQQMVEWYNTGRVYLCTSESEGVPNTALEAAACGCAIVSTRVGRMLEVVQDGKNGYLFSLNAKELADAVELACNRYEWMAYDVHRIILQSDWRRLAKHYYDLMDKLCSSNQRT